MARRVEVEIVGDSSKLERAFKRSERSAGQFKNKISGTFKGGLTGRGFAALSAGLLGGAGVVAGMKGVIDAASDMNEQMSKTDVVFGDSAKAIEEWSKKSATAMGLSRREALATASSFGALFQPLGIVGDEATKQAEGLTQLGADLASFYNTDVQSALDAIRSGLVGESEPLRKYGALLSETRVQQEALTETGKKNAAQLTDQDKVLARIALIYKDTSQAQGDFARTSGGLANQQRILRANLDNLRTVLGQAFLPMVTRAIKSFNAWITQSKNQKQVLDIVKQVAGALTAVLKTLKGVFDGLNAITGSTKRTLELLLIAFLAFKTAKVVGMFTEIAGSIGLVGTKAATATGNVKTLSGGLAGLSAAPWVITLVVAEKTIRDPHSILDRAAGLRDMLAKGGPVADAIKALPVVGPLAAALGPLLRNRGGGGITPSSRAGQDVLDRVAGRAPTGPAAFPTAAQPSTTTRRRRRRDAATGFTLPFRFELAQAQADLTKSIADDVQVARQVAAFIRAKLPTLKGQKLLDAYQILAGALGTIRDAADTAAQASQDAADKAKRAAQAAAAKAKAAAAKEAAKAKAAAEAAKQFGVPLVLELAMSRAEALKKSIRPVLLAIKASAQRAIKSGRLGLQGLIDAYDTITSVNEQLAGLGKKTKRATAKMLDPGFGHGFNVAGTGGATGGGIVIHNLNLTGIQDVRQLENELISRSNARPQPRRGP